MPLIKGFRGMPYSISDFERFQKTFANSNFAKAKKVVYVLSPVVAQTLFIGAHVQCLQRAAGRNSFVVAVEQPAATRHRPLEVRVVCLALRQQYQSRQRARQHPFAYHHV